MRPATGNIYFFRLHTLTAYITYAQVWEMRVLLWTGMISVVIVIVAANNDRRS
jgi:hypothetical protein